MEWLRGYLKAEGAGQIKSFGIEFDRILKLHVECWIFGFNRMHGLLIVLFSSEHENVKTMDEIIVRGRHFRDVIWMIHFRVEQKNCTLF
jgi:hypothetical protein